MAKPLTYTVATVGTGRRKLIKKNLEYAIMVSFIDLDPDTLGAQVVIVDDRIAIRLNGRIYTEI